MLSVFQSRELGFGHRKLSTEEPLRINAARREMHCKDEETAKIVNTGVLVKPDLNVNPFCVEFECGAAKEGCFACDTMVLQLEDCIDMLKVLHPEHGCCFLFNHSCRQDKQRPDGLNPNNTNKGCGGKKWTRSTKIATEAGFLGPHEHNAKLQVGNVQHLCLDGRGVDAARNQGPFCLSSEKRDKTREDTDHVADNTRKEKSKTELLDQLASKDWLPQGKSKDTEKKEVQAMARENLINIEKPHEDNLETKEELKNDLQEQSIPGTDKCSLKQQCQKLVHNSGVHVWKSESDVKR